MSSVGTDLANAKNTLSSWDSCMAQDYCKYPVIVAIVVGSLILLSIVWCLARCLCCGAECCCGCLSCFGGCCPSNSSGRRGNRGYQQPPQPPPQYPPYGQYQSQPPPMYNPAYMYGAQQTATFDAPSSKKTTAPAGSGYHEDSLPAMPSWNTAATRRVEVEDQDPEEEDEAVEMEKLDYTSSQHQQQQGLLQGTGDLSQGPYSTEPRTQGYGYYARDGFADYNRPQPDAAAAAPQNRFQSPAPYGSSGANNNYDAQQQYTNMAANPYQDAYQVPQPQQQQPQQYQQYQQHPQQQTYNSPRSPVSPVNVSTSPIPAYGNNNIGNGVHRAPSSVYPSSSSPPSAAAAQGSFSPPPPVSPATTAAYPPSYHTRPPSVLNPGNGAGMGGGVNRRPVQGSWRDV